MSSQLITRFGLSLSKASLLSDSKLEREGFDKLSPNRFWGSRVDL